MEPNYAVAPGEYLQEWIEDEGLTQGDVASRLEVSRKSVNELVNGHARLNESMAMRLERVTGIPLQSWLTFEAGYRADLGRLQDESNLANYIDQIDPSVTKYLRSKGLVQATLRRPGLVVAEYLAFHRCGTFGAYLNAHEQVSQGDYALAALKEGQKKTLLPGALPTWLRFGDMTEQFERGRDYTFDEDGLRAAIPDLRERATRSNDSLLKDLTRMLADVGVVVIFVEPPEKFPLHGVTRWIENRVPVIQQTGRQKQDGFILWTLFHEIGHILNDPRGEMHLDFKDEATRNTAAEKSANNFAWDTLFGPKRLKPFHNLSLDQDIERVVSQAGVPIGVAVMQMRRSTLLERNRGHRLIRKIPIPYSIV